MTLPVLHPVRQAHRLIRRVLPAHRPIRPALPARSQTPPVPIPAKARTEGTIRVVIRVDTGTAVVPAAKMVAVATAIPATNTAWLLQPASGLARA